MMLNWQNTAWEFKEQPPQIAILPLACLEPHGQHFPLGTDQFIVSGIARRVAADLSLPTFLLPTWPLGTATPPAGHAGAISLEYATLWAVVRDIVVSILEHGIRRVVVINNHGSASVPTALPAGISIVKTAVRQLNYENPGLSAIWVQPFAAAREALVAFFPSIVQDVGVVESALLMHMVPALMTNVMDGERRGASAEKGRLALGAIVKATVTYIENSFQRIDQMKR